MSAEGVVVASCQSNHYCPSLSAYLASFGSRKARNVAISPHIPCAADPQSSLLVSMLTLWGRQTLWIRDSSHPQVPLGDPPEPTVPAGKGVRRNTENRGIRCRATRDGFVEPPCLIFLDPSWCQGFTGAWPPLPTPATPSSIGAVRTELCRLLLLVDLSESARFSTITSSVP